MERWIQTYTELTGLDDKQKKIEANGMRRAFEARRKGTGREPTAAQEQGKRVCFIEVPNEEALEARKWQDKFIRAREARGEESREQEKKGSEEDDDEWVPMVPNMEAGSSYLQTLRRS